MILPIYVYGWQLLRSESEEITSDYPGLQTLISDMFETMYKAEGCGLAASQVGLPIRLIVVDAEPFADVNNPDDPLRKFKKVFINLKITELSAEQNTDEEGCLSFPKIRENVKRPNRIKVEYMDENFNHKVEEYEGIAARIVQHEYDHIEGKYFIDKISPLKRKLLSNKLNSIVKGKIDCRYKIKTYKK
jgi:peptide deformylase